MRESLTCQQYVKTKSNKNIEEYTRQNNIMSSTVWGSDVEIFSAAIWLETDIFIFIDDTWNIFSHKATVSRELVSAPPPASNLAPA